MDRPARVTTAAERALSVRSEDHEGTRADCLEQSYRLERRISSMLVNFKPAERSKYRSKKSGCLGDGRSNRIDDKLNII